MSRWSPDDSTRSADVERGGTSERTDVRENAVACSVSPAEVRTLSESRDDRDRDFGRERPHHLQLPRGDAREVVLSRGREYRLRGSEVDLMEAVGQFRAVFVEDLARETSDTSRLNTDLRSLERQGLVETHAISRLHPAQTADVVALTADGQQLLDEHRDPERDHGQRYYGGWVKPAELWHDAALYHMARDVGIEVERDGGTVRRVILDDELKGRAFEALHRMRGETSDSSGDVHRAIASVQDVHVEGEHFVFPDVRLEVEDAHGSVRTVDLELVTEHYRGGQLSGKSNAGFPMFRAGSASTGRGGTPHSPED